MNSEFALQLSDIRLLQTLRLLEATTNDHPDQAAVEGVLAAIRTTRDTIADLRAALSISALAGHRAPAA
jgi:hypothetical protein